MKDLLIFTHGMAIGGVERALLGLLNSLATTRCQTDLFLMRHYGALLQYIPKNINLLPEKKQYASLEIPLVTTIKRGQFGVAWGRLYGRVCSKLREKELGYCGGSLIPLEYSHKYTKFAMPAISSNEYDCAISFMTPHYFVAEKVRAKQKIAWIHTDYTHVNVDVTSELAMWSKYDRIASISDAVTESFLKVFPSLASRIVLIENILPEKLVRTDATADVSAEMPDDGTVRLLSIGRFSSAKNFDNVPDICRRLLEMGLAVKWYLIGYGGDEALIRRKITESGMEEHVMILGKKDNPYPYIAACDLYVQPSRYEGKAVTVREAQMLGKPVVITNYATSASQLEDGVDGIVVPMDNAGCAEGIAALLRSPEKMAQLAENCRERDYSNAQEIEKIYNMME